MSKLNKTSNLDNYLTNNSLFRGSQKNKLVSPYVSHLNYFQKEDNYQQSYKKDSRVVNTVKKEYADTSQIPQKFTQNNNDILKPTNKKQPVQQVFQQKIDSFVKQKQILSDQNKMVSDNLEPPEVHPQEHSYHNNDLIRIESQEQQQRQQTDNTGIFVVKQQQIIQSDYSLKQKSQRKFNSPYSQSNDFQTKKALFNLKKTESNNVDIISANSRITKNQQIELIEAPRQTRYDIPNSLYKKNLNPNRNQVSNYIFDNIKKNTSQYLNDVNNRLIRSYKCLECLEQKIDSTFDKNLDFQCNNLRTSLFRMIQIQIDEFKQRERYQLHKRKYSFMADLYQIKCNIDLRLQQIQDYSHLLAHQYKWKSVMANIVTPNYEESIKFIQQKTSEIQKQSDIKIDDQMVIFKRCFHQNIDIGTQKQIKKILCDYFQRFIDLKIYKNCYDRSENLRNQIY